MPFYVRTYTSYAHMYVYTYACMQNTYNDVMILQMCMFYNIMYTLLTVIITHAFTVKCVHSYAYYIRIILL